MRHLLALILTLLATGALGACGADGEPEPGAGEQALLRRGHEGMEHVHGLGVRGGTLFLATHDGMWIARDGERKARRPGASRQDVMGFAILDDGRFIGSGHPELRQDLPPHLGLIESRDEGERWRSVSLLGEADFHVLEAAGSRVYGFDGVKGRFMASADGGRRWARRSSAPGSMFDLAIDPRSAERAVAATDRGLFTTADGGRGWRRLRGGVTGLVAWPSAKRLFLVSAGGDVAVSEDAGRRWRIVGDVNGQPVAFAADGADLYVAVADGTVLRSPDGGRSWTVRIAP